MSKTLDGKTFRLMVIEGAFEIEDKKQETNELNVFPVPDGDTGINMSLTMNAAKAELSKSSDKAGIGEVSDAAAAALLRGARGNSGVILSLLFRGFAKRMRGLSSAGPVEFAEALALGVETAYKAVMKPAEGTILTVSRVAAAAAVDAAGAGADISSIFDVVIDTAKEALEKTVDQNPVLKKAGVVDAGAFGYIAILEGMRAAFEGRAIKREEKAVGDAEVSTAFGAFSGEDITFTYCTEFIVDKDKPGSDTSAFRAEIEALGDSAVVVDDDTIVKVHVHTNYPDAALKLGLKIGALSSIKIDNMRIQHEEKLFASGGEQDASNDPEEGKSAPAAPEKKYGFVAVAAGAGLASLFSELGADIIVEGGQTMNPSTEDILNAVMKVPAKTVFVLPNNKNIIMAAQQAGALATDREVVVLQTKTIPQGVSALLVFDESEDVKGNTSAMQQAAQNVKTGQITYAARTSDFDGEKIKEGDYIAFSDGKMLSSGKDMGAIVKKLASEIAGKDSAFITIFFGEGVDPDEAEGLRAVFAKHAPSAEINIIDGGQPVYYYIVSVE